MVQGTALVSGTVDVPSFNREVLIAALRVDQAGESTFPEFLQASWVRGVVRYDDVDSALRTVAYFGSDGEKYVESYPAVEITNRVSSCAGFLPFHALLGSYRTARLL